MKLKDTISKITTLLWPADNVKDIIFVHTFLTANSFHHHFCYLPLPIHSHIHPSFYHPPGKFLKFLALCSSIRVTVVSLTVTPPPLAYCFYNTDENQKMG